MLFYRTTKVGEPLGPVPHPPLRMPLPAISNLTIMQDMCLQDRVKESISDDMFNRVVIPLNGPTGARKIFCSHVGAENDIR